MHSAQRQLGAYLAKGAFQSIRRRMDPEVYGGAPLLGFNGVVFKAHASARERAVSSAIRMTCNALKNQINQIIARDIAAANKILDAETGISPKN
jgi:glycerol-3-phosphate acyltransferase PlsX